jgi:outer membrane receptor protein involved in Fe transport
MQRLLTSLLVLLLAPSLATAQEREDHPHPWENPGDPANNPPPGPEARPDPDPDPDPDPVPVPVPVPDTPVPETPPPEPPPPRLTTGLRGVVVDSDSGDTLIEARIVVLRGPAAARTQVLTDLDGKYELPLPPGTYDLRVTADLYRGRRLRGVIVRRSGPTDLRIELPRDERAVEEIFVEARPDKRTESAGLQERKRSATVRDVISAQEISRSPDSSAGDAVKRVVSATVVGGRYVFIRGLGGRYSMTLLNGVGLPSPDPDQASVPLDIFPAGLLANLTVVKTYLPDLPGTFSGGALMIETNSYPTDFELKLKLGGAFDSQSTFRDVSTYDGGDTDFLGFDDGTRALPSSIPRDQGMRVGNPGIDDPAAERIAEDFSNIWDVETRPALPNVGFSLTAGDTTKLRGRDLGWLVSASYGHKDVVQRGRTAKAAIDGEGTIYERQTLDNLVGVEQVAIGALGNIGLRVGDRSSLNLFTLFTRSADDRAHIVSGFSETESQNVEVRRLEFTARQMSFTQLAGDHGIGPHDLRWQANVAYTTREEPDTRDMEFDLLEDGRRRADIQNSGERFFSDLEDLSGGASLDLGLGLDEGYTLKLGGIGHATLREFSARRFGYDLDSNDFTLLFLDPEQMFSDEHIGPDFVMEERTLQEDAYDAWMLLGGGYVLADVARFEPFRFIGGLRIEHSVQELTPGSPFAQAMVAPPGVERSNTHFLPGINAVYAVTPRMNLRAGYSFTLARPQFRELAPFLYYDFSRRRAVSGNPELVDTRIHNADVRWELFPGEREVLAASVFYKRFIDPIEVVVVNSAQQDLSFANADGATAIGFELEGRLQLGRFSRALSDFRLGANLTLIRSSIELGQEASLQTNKERPLQGQSPYVINVDFGWARRAWGIEASVLYNVYGSRIAEVGIEGLPDVYEQPFHRLDLSFAQDLGSGMKLKLGGTNLLDQAVVVKQGPVTVQHYEPGVTVSASIEWAR